MLKTTWLGCQGAANGFFGLVRHQPEGSTGTGSSVYQLDFVTPGIFPASAMSRNTFRLMPNFRR